jgi:predicted nuclease with RNAse H fold
MKYVGIDLAGNPKNDTGFCILEITGQGRTISASVLHSDSEIMERVGKNSPDLIAIDAPLTYAGVNRKCDEDLRSYGALPATLPGMEVLAKRGTNLAKELNGKGLKSIEVYATASAKILGFYDKDERITQKKLMDSNLEGDIQKRILSKDELDSVFCAFTAYLHASGQTEQVGDDEGKITIPKV